MTTHHVYFSRSARLLHWVMAVMIITMLFVGVGMVSTVTEAHDRLIAFHRPLGITILVLVVLRLIVRLTHKTPPLPQDLPSLQVFAAYMSHLVLYILMFCLPLVGWAMLSAGGYPIVLVGTLHLFPIMPHDLALYAVLRRAHTYLAFAFFAVFLVHVAAALMHALIRRDGVFQSMASWRKPGPAD